MHINYLLEIFKKNKKKDAIIWNNSSYTYDWLLKNYNLWLQILKENSVKPGSVIVIHADFSPKAISLLLAAIELKTIIVPLTDSVQSKVDDFINISAGEVVIRIDKNDDFSLQKIEKTPSNEYYDNLRLKQHPGLVLFSSGSTGESKASVHDLTFLLEKFKIKRHCLITITFLLYDHIGGFNTFYVLSNAGLIVTVQSRTPIEILKLIENFKVQLLPTSPTFLNMLLLSEDYHNYNLDSLELITYGTEPMPMTTLKKLNDIFPKVRFLQTYGLSEVGILRSKSKSSDSLWVKIGGEDYKTRIVDGMLEIKSKSSMLGYLNAPSPFTDDGWFKTGDSVEKNGEYIKIIGRKSEIINVGGEKVYPQEVENVLLSHPIIKDVTVYGEKNLITGNIVLLK